MSATSTDQWPTFVDLPEAWAFLELPGEPEEPQASRLQRYVDGACVLAQNRSGRPFGPTLFRERHDGWSGNTIQLHYSPVLELVLCREWQSSGGFVALNESTPEDPQEGVQLDYGTGQLTRTFSGYSWPRPFFPGHRNVEVEYLAGFNPVPADVWEATMELVVWRWRNSQQATRTWEVPGSRFQDEAASGLWPGVPNRVAEVFESYRLPGIG